MLAHRMKWNTTMRLGMIFLIMSNLTAYFLKPNAYLHEGATDALKGLVFGIAIGFLLLSVWVKGHRATE